MKKGLLILTVLLLLTGCKNKESKTDGKTSEEISYTNKFECSRVEKIKKYDLDGNSGHITTDQAKEREESPVAIEEKIQKIYDFNEDGSKLLAFYEIYTYEYVLDGYDMDTEKNNYDCGNYDEYGFKSCDITTNENSVIITKVADLTSDYNKDMVDTMTLESIKADYAEGEMYTCE